VHNRSTQGKCISMGNGMVSEGAYWT